jgi:predicted AAA+ superfamily ATPase
VPREDAIGKQALKFNEKFYLVDHGIRQALGYSNVAAVDQVIENVVYMELLRRGYEVRVGKVGDREIDFVATRGDERAYYQVTYLVASPETEEREFAPLEAVPDNHPKTVISLDEFPRNRNGIRGVHLADWLLE